MTYRCFERRVWVLRDAENAMLPRDLRHLIIQSENSAKFVVGFAECLLELLVCQHQSLVKQISAVKTVAMQSSRQFNRVNHAQLNQNRLWVQTVHNKRLRIVWKISSFFMILVCGIITEKKNQFFCDTMYFEPGDPNSGSQRVKINENLFIPGSPQWCEHWRCLPDLLSLLPSSY